MPQSWPAFEDLVSPVELTVVAQAVSPTDTGEDLLWNDFFSREEVPSVELWDVTTIDYRPTADRREWNARGRLIPAPIPARRRVSIVPIEARDKIDEKEMQRLSEQTGGNRDKIREIIGVTLPKRAERLAEACYRRLEVDAFNAWALGTIVQRNPENAAQTYTASFGFPGTRYTTAGTAWNDAGMNGYDLFLAWIAAAQDLVGPIQGAMMRLATFNVILADAPNLPNSVKMTRTQIEERIQDDLGNAFEIIVNENSVDVFDDGGLTYTRTKVWPALRVAAIPAGMKVGRAAFAPVARAQDLSQQVPEAGIDVRGVSVYHEISNGGRELAIEGQINALPIPDEQKVYVTNVGV
jgi:hypothetical protein